MSHLLCQTDNPTIVGDINIPWNKTDILDTISLTEILELYKQPPLTNKAIQLNGWWVLRTQKKSLTYTWVSVWPLYHQVTIQCQKTQYSKNKNNDQKPEKINQEEFARDLELELIKNTHDGQTLQELYDGFISSIETTLDMHAPMRKCTKNSKKQSSMVWSWCKETQTAKENSREKLDKI